MERAQKVKAVFLDASGTLFQSNMMAPTGISLYPDARKILAAVRNRRISDFGVKTGIITNWGSRIQIVLESFGLMHHFDTVICGVSPLKPKPDPSIFFAACESIGLAPNECVHIGDSIYDDALGAQDAGLEAIWLNRRRQSFTETEQELIAQLRHPPARTLDEALVTLETLF